VDAAQTHRHTELGFELRLPPSATVLDSSELGLVLELPGGDGATPARVVLTVEPAEPGSSLRRLADRALAAVALGSAMIDRQPGRLGGVAADHSLSHREVQGTGVTVEEWRAVATGRLFTISAVCASAAYGSHADGFAAVAGELRITEPTAPAAVAAAQFDPASGVLIVTDAGFEALRAAARREPPGPDAVADTEALEECGALVAGRPHPALESALAPTSDPLLELTITWDESVARGWAHSDRASLLVPIGRSEHRRLVGLPASLLPGVLAGMLGLAPRPAAADREPVDLGSAELGRLVAEQREALAGLRGHWRVDARWIEEQRMEMLEVLDAEQGLWLVVPQEGGAQLRPTRAAEVWRHLTGLIPG